MSGDDKWIEKWKTVDRETERKDWPGTMYLGIVL